jgi:hypothetical protein
MPVFSDCCKHYMEHIYQPESPSPFKNDTQPVLLNIVVSTSKKHNLRFLLSKHILRLEFWKIFYEIQY